MALTSEQIQSLFDVVQKILGGLMSADGGSGPIAMLREFGAATDFLKDAATKYADNDIVKQLITGLVDAGQDGLGAATEHMNVAEMTSEKVLGDVSQTLDSLDFGDQGDGVKHFLFEMAERVAEASGKGLFGTGQKVTENEQEFLASLKTTLGI